MDGFGGQQLIIDFDKKELYLLLRQIDIMTGMKLSIKFRERLKKTPRNFFLRVSNLFNFCI